MVKIRRPGCSWRVVRIVCLDTIFLSHERDPLDAACALGLAVSAIGTATGTESVPIGIG